LWAKLLSLQFWLLEGKEDTDTHLIRIMHKENYDHFGKIHEVKNYVVIWCRINK
jgi:hypothetical protein